MTKIFISLGIFIAVVGVVLIITIIVGRPNPEREAKVKVILGRQEYLTEVADTPALKAQGLSGRDSLAVNRAMLFPFDRPGIYPFWMKGMKFSIDIIWIRGNKIIGFAESAKFGSLVPAIYYPPSEIDAVLEVAAGTIQKSGLKVGDLVTTEAVK